MQGFDKHVKDDHNMWNYVYYSIYLDQIDVTDHNATQKYLYDKVGTMLCAHEVKGRNLYITIHYISFVIMTVEP